MKRMHFQETHWLLGRGINKNTTRILCAFIIQETNIYRTNRFLKMIALSSKLKVNQSERLNDTVQ